MNSKLKQILLTEVKIEDKITTRTDLTYSALINAILDHKDKKIDNSNISDFAKEFNISEATLKKYVEKAKKHFLNKDGSVINKYIPKTKGKLKAAGKISQALDARVKRFKAPKVSNNNLFSNQVFKMLSLMKGQATKAGIKNSLMLTGDPGVGKTSFIRNFAKLLGLPLIPIEAPHITEEHIINIPFMIIRGNRVKKENAIIETSGNASQTLTNDNQTFDIVQAESNLVTKLKAMKNYKLKEKQHLALIARDKNLRPIYMNYKNLIDTIRESYNCILFLDEYYRNDNIKIRNILRNILNGRIGNDKIPKGTFIVYASNIDDEGVEDIPMNNDFVEMEFKAPDKEQWFKYILNKYENNKEFSSVKLNPDIYNKFYDTLSQNDLSYDDLNSDVRTSPRRWEQIILYVNSVLPVSNIKEAKALMANLKVNFRNYIEGDISEIYPKIEKMVVELINETSGINFDGEATSDVDWKDTLEQQLEVKIKLDANSDNKKELRQYVPVVSGEPGIGKTAHMQTVADNLDLHFIHIDVSTLTRESTTGIPIAKQAVDLDGNPEFDENGNPVMTTEFSKPELLNLIEKKMQEEIEADSIFPENERKKGKGKYKFLLLFDELTRADPQVFNSIRKLLLEKSFNEQYDLPDSIMTVGALNPEDTGADELTKHVRDVLDIIPARASWAKTESYLLSEERPHGLQEALGFDLNNSTVQALKFLLQQYQTTDEDWRGNKVTKEEKLFNIREGGNIIYISPREITDIVTMTNANILNRLTVVGLGSLIDKDDDTDLEELSDEDFLNMVQKQESDNQEKEKGLFKLGVQYSDEDYDAFIKAMVNEFRDVWASKVSFICKKMEIDASNFLSVTTKFISKNDTIYSQYETIKKLLVDDIKSINEMFTAYYDNPDDLYDSPHFDNYLSQNFSAPQKFIQEITDFIADRISDIEQNNSKGTQTYINALGKETEIPNADAEKLKLYFNYLKYVRVILKVLTKKAQYVDKVKEAERTGQYLGNLKVSLETIGRDFMSKHNLLPYFNSKETLNPKLLEEGRKVASDIKKILADFGFKPKTSN